ncbi:transposase [Planctomicrobium piriforme]|uniref:Type I restriction enzyme, R subunit n=1 Tax=Planctomicrobium piriforme TaxID=1576369 RepID=A0A1I3IGP0_9PLAN|nr:transposase [Planctomicrobium piriforme]SFI47082.1 type I restriction enzyme, R subunit [Planctomicrobium piriforme]
MNDRKIQREELNQNGRLPSQDDNLFQIFDPTSEYSVSYGHLPHWSQPGVTYFVTFRADDSIPASVSELWHRRRAEWLFHHGILVDDPTWRNRLRKLSLEKQLEFEKTFSCEFLSFLDRGYGSCPFKKPEIAAVVLEALQHFDGDRYVLGDAVIMPNHVHLLVCLLKETEIETQCYSWKKFSATKINRLLNRTGRLWQSESFDHLVRSPEQFDGFRKYIANNPTVARLNTGEYLHFRRDA